MQKHLWFPAAHLYGTLILGVGTDGGGGDSGGGGGGGGLGEGGLGEGGGGLFKSGLGGGGLGGGGCGGLDEGGLDTGGGSTVGEGGGTVSSVPVGNLQSTWASHWHIFPIASNLRPFGQVLYEIPES